MASSGPSRAATKNWAGMYSPRVSRKLATSASSKRDVGEGDELMLLNLLPEMDLSLIAAELDVPLNSIEVGKLVGVNSSPDLG